MKSSHPHQERHGIIAHYQQETAAGDTTFLENAALARWTDALGAHSTALLVSYHPGDIAQLQWDLSEPIVTQQRFAAQGTGYVEYVLTLPDEQEHELAKLPKTAERLTLVFEASAFNGGARQTEPEKYPTDVTVSVNGVEIETVTLPDCPADARGTLSYIHGEPGTYGYLTRLTIEGTQLEQVRAKSIETLTLRYEVKSDAEHRGGFALYGSRRGRYPTAPHLLFSSKHSDPP